MFIMYDGFYADPDSVREYALSQDFSIKGNYPGARTSSLSHLDNEWFFRLKEYMEELIHKEITYWPDGYNTAFQYTTKDSTTWAHHDQTQWAAVVYLTPNAPLSSGTGVYRRKDTGIYRHEESHSIDYNELTNEEADWELQDQASNIYNRAVIYHGNLYHRSIQPGFGNNQYNGRLFQTFFFNTRG